MIVQRRLAAVLSADIVGYGALMERDEAGTLARVSAVLVEVVEPAVAAQGGRVVKLGALKNASNKVLVAEEDSIWINDGLFAPPADSKRPTINPHPGGDMLSVRHDSKRREPDMQGLAALQSNAPEATAQRRGNAAFADGHAEYISREELHDVVRIRPAVEQ